MWKVFRSSAKVFNPLESRILQYEVWICLLYKNPAQPKKVFSCQYNEKNKNIKDQWVIILEKNIVILNW